MLSCLTKQLAFNLFNDILGDLESRAADGSGMSLYVNCLHSGYHLAVYLKHSLMGMLCILEMGKSITLDGRRLAGGSCLDIPHLEAQAKYFEEAANKNLNTFTWPILCSMQPKDRRAAIRMQMIARLLWYLPQIVPAGFHEDNLPRLAAVASGVIMDKIHAQKQGELLSMAEQSLFDTMEKKTTDFEALVLGNFNVAWTKFQKGIDAPGGSSSAGAPSSETAGLCSKLTQSCSVTVDLRAGLLSVVADILPDVAPSVNPSSLPAIAGKVTDDILSGGTSYDAVPSRAEVSSLVQDRMGMIKGLIKEGRQTPVALAASIDGLSVDRTPSHITVPGPGGMSTKGMATSLKGPNNSAPPSGHRTCSACGVASQPDADRMKKCPICRVTYYCSAECQKADW